MSAAAVAGTVSEAAAAPAPPEAAGAGAAAEGSGGNNAEQQRQQQQQQQQQQAPGLGAQGRKVSTQDIQLVQNLIERCLQMYMSRREVVYTLQQQAKVEPGFTQLVWQKLEEQNPDFFQAYYTRLKLKDQIVLFNHLLEQQVAMFQKMSRQYMTPAGIMMAPRAAHPMPGMPYQGGMLMPSSVPVPQHLGIKAEDLGEAEGTGRSDQLGGSGGDADMGIAGLSLPAGSGIIDGLGGMSAPQPFTSADSLGMAPMAMSSPLRAGGSGDLGMARNLSFSNFGTFADFEHGLGGSAGHHDASMLQANAPRDLPRNFSLSELADLGDLDGGSKQAASGS